MQCPPAVHHLTLGAYLTLGRTVGNRSTRRPRACHQQVKMPPGGQIDTWRPWALHATVCFLATSKETEVNKLSGRDRPPRVVDQVEELNLCCIWVFVEEGIGGGRLYSVGENWGGGSCFFQVQVIQVVREPGRWCSVRCRWGRRRSPQEWNNVGVSDGLYPPRSM